MLLSRESAHDGLQRRRRRLLTPRGPRGATWPRLLAPRARRLQRFVGQAAGAPEARNSGQPVRAGSSGYTYAGTALTTLPRGSPGINISRIVDLKIAQLLHFRLHNNGTNLSLCFLRSST